MPKSGRAESGEKYDKITRESMHVAVSLVEPVGDFSYSWSVHFSYLNTIVFMLVS